jgi:hypothetical protein
VVETLTAALQPTDVVIGGGNVKKLKTLPPNTRAGDNDNAFIGGFRLWEERGPIQTSAVCTHGAGQSEDGYTAGRSRSLSPTPELRSHEPRP